MDYGASRMANSSRPIERRARKIFAGASARSQSYLQRRCVSDVKRSAVVRTIVAPIVRGVLDVVLILIGILLVVLCILRIVGRVLLSVLGGVLLREARARSIIIIVDDRLTAKARTHAPIAGANSKRIVVPGKKAADRIGQKHAARYSGSGPERTGQKSAAAASATAPWTWRWT